MKIISILFPVLAVCVPSCSTVSTRADTTLFVSGMDISLPSFSISWNMFEVPTLGELSRVTARSVRRRLYGYAKIYSSILMKHLSTETEVLIQHGRFSKESEQILTNLGFEMGILQYRMHLKDILKDWLNIISGQPLEQAVQGNIAFLVHGIVSEFKEFIYKLQGIAIKNRR